MKRQVLGILLVYTLSLVANPLSKRRYAYDDSILIRHRNHTIEKTIRRYVQLFKDDVARTDNNLSRRSTAERIETHCLVYRQMVHEREKAHRAGRRLLDVYTQYEEHMRDALYELQLQRNGELMNGNHRSYRNREV